VNRECAPDKQGDLPTSARWRGRTMCHPICVGCWMIIPMIVLEKNFDPLGYSGGS
jgi:hypothetical protein